MIEALKDTLVRNNSRLSSKPWITAPLAVHVLKQSILLSKSRKKPSDLDYIVSHRAEVALMYLLAKDLSSTI